MIIRLLGFFGLLISTNAQAQSAYDALLSTLYSNSVPTISVDSLENFRKTNQPVLLDTRARPEFEVSHIQGARWVDYDSFDPAMVAGIPKNQPVVVYCSVGYRSEKIGEKLKELGYTDVRNLYGGIFQWKNNGHTIVNLQGQPTDSVHCYNKLWSIWMKNGVKVYD